MTRYLLALTLLLALVAAPALAEANLIKAGQEIGEVSQWMKDAGYAETQLQTACPDESVHLKEWIVGDGVLVCSFSTKDNVVKDLTYGLCEKRPKADRREFLLLVTQFVPSTGEMTIQVSRKPTPGGEK
ncbi:hypothetical protein ACFL59_09225, partial [Planctomycetota bacterium]